MFSRFNNIIFLILILVASCNKNDKEFYIYPDLIDNQTYIVKIDTFTVKNSTIILDSFITSSFEKMFVGYYDDSLIGSINCMTVFQLGLPSTVPSSYDQLDSASLIIKFDGYSYGDTTSNCKYQIYSLTEFPENESNSGYYYNTTLIKYSQMIGMKEFRPYPHIDKELSIPIYYDFANEIFTGLIEQSEYFQSSENFLKYLPGLIIKADSLKTKSIIRFLASSNNVYLRLYIRKKELMNETYNIDLPIINTSSQFNIISKNLKPYLKNYRQKDRIDSEIINNLSIIYSGYGILTRFDFPYLNNLFLIGNFKILKAILNFKPDNYFTDIHSINDSLVIGYMTYQNKIESFFYNSQGNYLLPGLTIDEIYNENTWYKFDITPFFSSGYNQKWFDPEVGIFICYYPDLFYKSFKKMVIDSKSIRLDLYLLKY